MQEGVFHGKVLPFMRNSGAYFLKDTELFKRDGVMKSVNDI